jgi:Domain of unknown function (DUF4365)
VRDPESARTGRVGFALVQLAVVEQLRWLFRGQPQDDYGIDAQMEIVEDGNVVPRLLALQIKGGPYWFKERGPGGWWYRPKAAHVQYWTNHSLPVVVVLVNPESKQSYWQIVSATTLERTAHGGWKLLVPERQVLDERARAALREAAEGDPYVLRIRELQLALPWMELLAEGKRLVVDMAEWINKSSGRGSVTLGIDNEDGQDPEPLGSWNFFPGPANYGDAVPRLFAWADAAVHEETYDEADREQFEAECVIYDEGDRIVTADYGEWQAGRGLRELRPYSNAAGEVDYWRLELTLNELGRAFLIVNQFGMEGERQLTPEPET